MVLGDDVRLDAHAVIYSGRYSRLAGVVQGIGGDRRHRFRLSSRAAAGSRPHSARGRLHPRVTTSRSARTAASIAVRSTTPHRPRHQDRQPRAYRAQRAHRRDCLMMAGVGHRRKHRARRSRDPRRAVGVRGPPHARRRRSCRARSPPCSPMSRPGKTVTGYPARPHREFLRGVATMYRLGPHGDALEQLATGARRCARRTLAGRGRTRAAPGCTRACERRYARDRRARAAASSFGATTSPDAPSFRPGSGRCKPPSGAPASPRQAHRRHGRAPARRSARVAARRLADRPRWPRAPDPRRLVPAVVRRDRRAGSSNTPGEPAVVTRHSTVHGARRRGELRGRARQGA